MKNPLPNQYIEQQRTMLVLCAHLFKQQKITEVTISKEELLDIVHQQPSLGIEKNPFNDSVTFSIRESQLKLPAKDVPPNLLG